MKRIAILAAVALTLVLVLVVGVGGVAQADCFATNCAINEQQQAATPAQGDSGTEGATTPKVEDALKESNHATEHALTGPTTPTKSAPPAAPCTGSNCEELRHISARLTWFSWPPASPSASAIAHARSPSPRVAGHRPLLTGIEARSITMQDAR
jgi:hypothetical protein